MLDFGIFGQAFLAVGALNGKLAENLGNIGGKLVNKVLATKGAFQHPKLLASHEEHATDLYETA